MKIRELSPYFDQIVSGKYLIGIKDKTLVLAISRSYKDNKLYLWYNSLIWNELDDFYLDNEVYDNISLDERDIDIVSYDMFNAWIRRSVVRGIIEERNSKETNNLKHITAEVEKSGGRIIAFTYGGEEIREEDCGLLIGAVSSDDDYYYIYADTNCDIHFMTCVSGFQELRFGQIPQSLRKFAKGGVSRTAAKQIYTNLIHAFTGSCEVMFT